MVFIALERLQNLLCIMSPRSEHRIFRPKYTIRSRRHLKMEFKNGQIDVWMKNPNLNIHNPADIPLCLKAILDSFPFENEAFMNVNNPRWSESQITQILSHPNCINLLKRVRKNLLGKVIQCPRCKRDISLVVIRRKPT